MIYLMKKKSLSTPNEITCLRNIELAPLYSISAIFIIAAQECRTGIEAFSNIDPLQINNLRTYTPGASIQVKSNWGIS